MRRGSGGLRRLMVAMTVLAMLGLLSAPARSLAAAPSYVGAAEDPDGHPADYCSRFQ